MKLDLDDLLNAAEQKQETDRMVFWYPENRILLLDEHDQPADDLGEELNPDDYEVLPDWEDLNRYQLMEDFADRQPDGEVKNWLQNAIKGHGAFRRFRSVIERFGLQDEWYDFEEEAEYLHAAEWCRAHHLDYEEVPGIPDLSMTVHAEKKKEPQKPEIRITRLSSRNAMQIIYLLHELRAEEAKHRNLTSPDLEDSIKESIEGKEELILDFENLSYVSSAGLRVLLAVQKIMNGCGGTMKVLHVNQEIMDIFDVTGFADILTIDNSEDEKCCEEEEECCKEEKE